MEFKKLTLKIEALNSEGSGVARHEGKVYFVPWAVPGDTVGVQVEADHPRYADARVLEIIEKSSDRTAPPHAPITSTAAAANSNTLTTSPNSIGKKPPSSTPLKKIARIENPPVEDVLPSPKIWNYRSRIRLHKDRQGKIGFHRPQSHSVVEIDACLIADDRLNEKLKEKRQLFSKVTPDNKGKSQLELRLDESLAFSQVNPEQNENLRKLVLEAVGEEGRAVVFDLYAGSGNLTFPLAKASRKVFAVETSQEAIVEGVKRAEKQSFNNIQWTQGATFRVLIDLKNRGIKPDVIVVDPPRRGLAEAVEGVISHQPKKIIYVSCDPGTFARDANQILKAGYQLVICKPLDMFPHTAHIELVALFVKEKI